MFLIVRHVVILCVFISFCCHQCLSVLHGILPFPDQWSLTSVFSLSDIKLMKNIISIKYALATVFHFFQESDFIQLLPFSGGLSNNFCTEPIFQRHMITKRGTKLDSWEIVLKKCGDEYDYNWTFVKTWIPVKTLFRAISPLKLVLPGERLRHKNVKRQMWEIQLHEDGAWLRSRQWW